MVKSMWALLTMFCLMLTAGTAAADEEMVRKFIRSYAEAFNRQDLDAVAAMWTESGHHVDRNTGERTEGRAAIRADLEQLFQGPGPLHLTGTVDQIRFVTPTVVSAQGTTTTSAPDEEPTLSQFTAILVQQDGKWLIDSIEESPAAPAASPFVALSELEWLVGRWVDDSDEERIVSTVRWSGNQTFLIRSISSETAGNSAPTPLGTEIIGWDPRSRQIRSWTFNADGSFGDSVWSKADADWIIRSTQVLPDGEAASGTYIVTMVDPNTLTWQLVGHEVEGRPSPSSEAVTVTRVPEVEEPAVTEPQPSSK
jgi:uncharacterized protein (TIGR02246 family)